MQEKYKKAKISQKMFSHTVQASRIIFFFKYDIQMASLDFAFFHHRQSIHGMLLLPAACLHSNRGKKMIKGAEASSI